MPTESINAIRRADDPIYRPTYEAVGKWRDASLRNGVSLFDPQRKVWTSDVVAELHYRVIVKVDESARSFSDKLADQLLGASQEVFLLAAEMLYVHLLAVNNVSAMKKLENINAVGVRAPEPFEVPATLIEPLDLGLVNGGAGFNTNRFYLIEFLIEFAAYWAALSEEARPALLDDPWAFKAALIELPQRRANAQRNALLFLLFPDDFEDISSNDHKQRIVDAFPEHAGESTDLDRQLLAARRALANQFGNDFSWYSSQVRPLWDVTKKAEVQKTGPTSLSEDFERMFPVAEDLKVFFEFTARVVRAAHDLNDRSWSLSRIGKGLSLNIGPNSALKATEDELAFFAAGSRETLVATLEASGVKAEVTFSYAFPENVSYIKFGSSTDFISGSKALSGQVTAAVTASARRNTPYFKSFSQEVALYLEEALGTELPRPATQPPKDSDRAWIVRVKRDDGSGTAEALENGELRVFWDINVPPGSAIDEIRTALRHQDPDLSNNMIGNQAGNLHRFITRMKPGDLVLMPNKSDLYFGTVAGDAVFEPRAGEWVRAVAWANVDDPVDRSSVSAALYSRLRTLLTVTEVSDLMGEIRSFSEFDDVPPIVQKEARLVPIDADTAQTWMLDRDWLQEIVDMLSAKKQIIFYGPPGTGKTYLASKLANHLVANGGNYQVVQFHPSYTYEDFVEGFRPRVADGNMTYELSPGPLKHLAEAARENPADPYFLIIDEINRGNLAKIFGELYYLLEYRDESLTLQYGNTADEQFSLPKNLFVIGTMNTADRSIAMVDAAIRRRFYFVEFSPLRKPIDGLLRAWLKRERIDDTAAQLLEELNRNLGDADYAIGPSYLMTERIGDQRELERIWRHAIMPLLTEHFYGRPGAADRFEIAALQRSIDARRTQSDTDELVEVSTNDHDVDDASD